MIFSFIITKQDTEKKLEYLIFQLKYNNEKKPTINNKRSTMENVAIWYITDNGDGEKIAVAIKKLGLTIHLIKKDKNLKNADIISEKVNIFIFDIKEKKLAQIMSLIRNNEKISNCLKFVILFKKQIKEASISSLNQLHVEYISRKVNIKEFVLLLEKSIIVERYKDMMRYFSIDAEDRIQNHESLMDIARKDAFESDKEKDAFIDIIRHEKHLVEEQNKLNKAIREFTMLRQTEMFELKNRIKAEEMLGDLRRNELLDAHNVVQAQEAVLDYSSTELKGANKIIDATEKVQELSRAEALKLHSELVKLTDEVKQLKEENRKLKKEMKLMKSKR